MSQYANLTMKIYTSLRNGTEVNVHNIQYVHFWEAIQGIQIGDNNLEEENIRWKC